MKNSANPSCSSRAVPRRVTTGWGRLSAIFVVFVALPFACRDFDPNTESSGNGATGGGGAAGEEMRGSAPIIAGIGGYAAGQSGGPPTFGGTLGAAGTAGGDAGGGAGEGPGGGGAGGKATTLAPSSLAQLVLWLEATKGTCTLDGNQTVSDWADQSPAMNDATTRGTFLQPKYVEAVANGHDALRFEPVPVAEGPDAPTALTVPDSDSLDFGSSDFAYLLVMSWRNSTAPLPGYLGSGTIIAKQTLEEGYPGVLLLANYPAVYGNVLASTRLGGQLKLGGAFVVSRTDGFADGAFRLYVARRVGTAFSLRVNGAYENDTVISPNLDLGARGYPLAIGGNSGSALDGDIAELIALRGATSDADFTALEAWLMEKYRLP